MTKIFITGVNGFVGRNLVQRWKTKFNLDGCDLRPMWQSQTDSYTIEPFDNWHSQVHHLDIRSNYDPNILTGSNIVVHCAARTRIDPSWDDYSDYYETNITASQRLFEHCQQQQVEKFIYFSSSSVYGNSDDMQEDVKLAPTNPYAISKAAAEMALTAQALKGTTKLIIVRPFTMYGDYMNVGKDSLAIAKFVQATQHNNPIRLEGSGNQERDYIHVYDAIDALELIIEHGQNGEVFNIGTGSSISIKKIADAISPNQIIVPDRLGAVNRTCANIDKLRALGFKAKVDILEWLSVYLKNMN
jgi:nucleoside-diphosphate-sugar epimerase